MLKFKKVRFKNFMSYGEQFTEVDLDTHDSTLVIGKNGQGKSSVIESITFGLYGKPYRKIKKDQLVNSVNAKGTLVEIEFEVNNGSYMVRRGIKPVVFEVFYNGNLLNQDNKNKDYQRILESQILKMSYKSFTQMVVLGSSRYEPFMTLKAADRRSIIEELLDISIFSVMQTEIKNVIANQKQIIKDAQAEHKNFKVLIKENEIFLKKLESSKNTQIADIQKSLNDLAAKLEGHNSKLKKIDDFAAEHSDAEDKAKKALNKYGENTDKSRELKTEINKDLKMVKFFNDHTECPTCTQTINDEFRIEIRDKHQSQADSNRTLFDDLVEKSKKLKEYHDKQMEAISGIKSLRIEVSNDIRTTEALIKDATKRMKSTETNTDNTSEIIEKIETLNSDLEALNKSITKDMVKMKYFELCLKLTSDGGMKAQIISTYLPMINTFINKNLSTMDFFVSFYLDENFEETIKSRFRDTFSYASFSEGEKARINMAILFAMIEIAKAKNSVSTNLLFLDEIFDSSIDLDGAESLSKLLNDAKMNVIVISHNANMANRFSRVLIAEKQGNFSSINEI